MKFPTALVALVALSASALAKKDKKPEKGSCTDEQEYDMGCSDTVSPHLGINTIVICRNKHWHVLHACPAKHFCTDEPEPHCWTGNPVDNAEDNADGFVHGTHEVEEYFWGTPNVAVPEPQGNQVEEAPAAPTTVTRFVVAATAAAV